MYALGRFGIVLGLDTIHNILTKLNNPHHTFKTIHIAGTNGKGSVASALSTILVEAGMRVGLYTSPHLIHFNERICIDNTPISDDEVVEAYLAVKAADIGERNATFFELATAMAFYEFSRKQVDWAVIETGMGGRLDATNIITPELTIITNISLEHKTYLGNTIYDIAEEKAGIIKKNKPVITGVRQESAIKAVEKVAKEQNAPLYRLKKDFRTRKNKDNTFTYMGVHNTMRNMETGLMGNYQVDNAALTLAACEVLRNTGLPLDTECIRAGLKKNQWPGRLEVIASHPLTFVDGAHNLAAVRNLKGFLAENFSQKKLTLVVGILDDKPYETILNILLPGCHRLILTRPDNIRSMDPNALLPIATPHVSDTTVIETAKDALQHAMETAGDDEVICVAGSLYLVGEAKAAMQGIHKKSCTY